MKKRRDRMRARRRPRERETAERVLRKADRVITASAVSLPFVYVPVLALVFNVHLVLALLTHVVLVATAGLLAFFIK